MEYQRLTKLMTINDKECITCALLNTDKCKIHTGEVTGCFCCPVVTAIYNQLYAFEEAYPAIAQSLTE